MVSHINLAYTRDYSNISVTNLAGLSKLVLISEVLSVEMLHKELFGLNYSDVCASFLSLFMHGAFPKK